MMERCKRITALLLVALIGWITVIECHHHDVDGHAFFLTINDTEMTPGFAHGDCHTHQDAGHRDEADRCAMHLSEASSPRVISYDFTPEALSLFLAAASFAGINCCEADSADDFLIITDDSVSPQNHTDATSLRAPPAA